MSCRHWPLLLAHRFDSEMPVPPGWSAALEHLDECPSCRREATAIDPTLAFRGASSWSPGPDESASIRLAVRALRRTGRLRGAASAAEDRHRERLRARRRIASAALFSVALALLPSVVDRAGVERLEGAAAGAFGVGSAALRGARPWLGASPGPVAPAIDGLDRPQARVYEWGGEDLSVVMVVDESLDV